MKSEAVAAVDSHELSDSEAGADPDRAESNRSSSLPIPV
jgi:hypothetical protein